MINIVKRSLLAVSALALAFGILAAGSVPAALADDSYQVRLVATPSQEHHAFVRRTARRLPRLDRHVQRRLQDVHLRPACRAEHVYQPRPLRLLLQPGGRGRYVVFQGSTTGGYDDIYLYDRDAARVTIISSLGLDGDRDDWNPRIQGGRVVWQKRHGRSGDGIGHLPLRHRHARKETASSPAPSTATRISGATTWCASRTRPPRPGPTPPRSSSTT